jgi:hypothetical protein
MTMITAAWVLRFRAPGVLLNRQRILNMNWNETIRNCLDKINAYVHLDPSFKN